MQVRTRHSAGRADGPQQIASCEPVADFHFDLFEMAVHRHEAVAVIDEQRVAVEEKVARLDHRA